MSHYVQDRYTKHMIATDDRSRLTDLMLGKAPFRIRADMMSQRPNLAAQCNAV